VLAAGCSGELLEAADGSVAAEELLLAQVAQVDLGLLGEVLGREAADQQHGQVNLHEADFPRQPAELLPPQLLGHRLASALGLRERLPPDRPVEPSKEE